MVYDPKAGIWLSRDPSGEAGGLNLYEAFKDDPINWNDPDGLAPVSTTQPATPLYAGTFLENMTPAAATALANALIAAKGRDLTNQQAFSIPLTSADAGIYLQAIGRDSYFVTGGIMRDSAEGTWLESAMGARPYNQIPSYAEALKKNPALGMTKAAYYQSLADAQNISMARDVMQMSNNAMANLYARLALPTANLIAATVTAPMAIPSGGNFYSSGFGPTATRIIGNPAVTSSKNIALGLETIEGKAALAPFAESVGGITSKDFSSALLTVAPEGRFDLTFAEALDNSIANGGRIKFNLDSLDIPKALGGNPNVRLERYTEWELQQIVSKPRWYGKTDFYLNGTQLTSEELAKLGIVLKPR